ncbi:hypothetical protein [Halovivax sp.]|uniref:hypothetical protein n=1 Tax=Halovivax sp. TaxID=1935978 RepID=UPI0025BC4040|nr:hypothetical protein [Halovivax sp.]
MSDRLRPATVANRARFATGLATLAAGFTLLAHPRYFDSLTVYPGTGWWFFPMFHAAFTALGVVAVGSGWFLFRSRVPSDRELSVLAVATILAAAAYAAVLLRLTGVDPGVVDGYGGKRALVGGLIAGLFLLGFAMATRRRRVAVLGILASVAPLSFVVLEWGVRDGAVLGPVVDVFILLTNPAVLGIENLGVVLLLAAGALGLSIGAWAARSESFSTPTGTESTHAAGESD